MKVYGVIPARLQSTRLPRKLLLAETGLPLLQYTWNAACGAKLLDEVLVATDSPEIQAVVTGFGGRCFLTGEHPSGTDRIAEVARKHCPDGDVFVNIQGDEPEIDPQAIDRLVEAIRRNPDSPMATLATPIRSREQLDDRACTKVVCTSMGRALYFSRSLVPFVRDANFDELLAEETPWLLHLGIYAYRRDFLLELTSRPPCRLEQLEKLEQLRALEMGASIEVQIIDQATVGIDTPEDYARFVERVRRLKIRPEAA